MRHLLLFLLFIYSASTIFGQSETDSLLRELKMAISNARNFDNEKEKTIELLNDELYNTQASDLLTQFKICNRLFQVTSWVDALNGGNISISNQVTLPAYGYLVLKNQ
jgi:hypothetical protein